VVSGARHKKQGQVKKEEECGWERGKTRRAVGCEPAGQKGWTLTRPAGQRGGGGVGRGEGIKERGGGV